MQLGLRVGKRNVNLRQSEPTTSSSATSRLSCTPARRQRQPIPASLQHPSEVCVLLSIQRTAVWRARMSESLSGGAAGCSIRRGAPGHPDSLSEGIQVLTAAARKEKGFLGAEQLLSTQSKTLPPHKSAVSHGTSSKQQRPPQPSQPENSKQRGLWEHCQPPAKHLETYRGHVDPVHQHLGAQSTI